MITTASIKGPRYSQEDRFVTVQTVEGLLLAVMDGHGGCEVSKFLASHLASAWSVESEQAPNDDIEMLMRNVIGGLHQCTKDEESGSTLSMVLIPKNEKVAHVAILGDSPVIVCQPNGDLHISPDHNVRTNEAERFAARSRGAAIAGGYMMAHMDGPGLQMTRVLGDRALDRIIDRTPEIYSVPLGNFVLLGSDGLFDPSHRGTTAEQAANFAAKVAIGGSAEDLIHIMGSPRDNVTAVLWTRDTPRIGASLQRTFESVRSGISMAAVNKTLSSVV